MVSMLLLKPPSFGFITQPTKRCLSLQFISEAFVTVERIAELCRAAAFELGATCSFHFRFGHRLSLSPYETRKRASVGHSHRQR